MAKYDRCGKGRVALADPESGNFSSVQIGAALLFPIHHHNPHTSDSYSTFTNIKLQVLGSASWII
jgi:hypothetical protein